MCEFSDCSDVSAVDKADISMDISESVDTDIGSEGQEIDDIAEDIEISSSDFDNDTSELNDIIEDVSESLVDEGADDISDYNIEDIPEDIAMESSLINEYIILENDTNECSEVIEENGYEYTLDENGRVAKVEGDLRLEIGERDVVTQRNAGGEFRRETDDGGHFIGNRFGGSSDDINMFAQDSNFNRGGYKSMENEWARELEKGNDVHVKIDPIYQEGTVRPHAIIGEYTVTENGNERTENFSHTNENLRSNEFNIDDYDFEFSEEKK